MHFEDYCMIMKFKNGTLKFKSNSYETRDISTMNIILFNSYILHTKFIDTQNEIH